MNRPAKKNQKIKTFDCVEFKRRAQLQWFEATREMSPDDRRDYSRRMIETGPLAEFWKTVIRRARTAPRAGRLRD